MRKRPLFVGLALLAAGVAALIACTGDDPVLSTVDDTPDGATADGNALDSAVGQTDAPATDGATATDAGADGSKPFDVTSLGGLRLWLESTKELKVDVGSGGFGTWTDSSGRWDGGANPDAPDGGKHVAVAYNVNPPSIVANGINGRPTVSFVSGNGTIAIDNHEDFHFGLGDFLIVEVANVSNPDGRLWSLQPQATAGSEEAFAPGSLCVSYGQGVTNGCTTTFTPPTGAHVYEARRKSDIFSIRVDGTERATLDRTASPPDIQVNMFAGPRAYIGNGLTAQISEVIILVGPTPDADLAKLETLLKSKYAIP